MLFVIPILYTMVAGYRDRRRARMAPEAVPVTELEVV